MPGDRNIKMNETWSLPQGPHILVEKTISPYGTFVRIRKSHLFLLVVAVSHQSSGIASEEQDIFQCPLASSAKDPCVGCTLSFQKMQIAYYSTVWWAQRRGALTAWKAGKPEKFSWKRLPVNWGTKELIQWRGLKGRHTEPHQSEEHGMFGALQVIDDSQSAHWGMMVWETGQDLKLEGTEAMV